VSGGSDCFAESIIEMAEDKILFFKCVVSLQGGCTEMMILRSVIQYDLDHATWTVPHSMNATNIRADILKLCPKGNVYEEHEKFIKTFDPKLRADENIVLILCAITLFCPGEFILLLIQFSIDFIYCQTVKTLFTQTLSDWNRFVRTLAVIQRVFNLTLIDIFPTEFLLLFVAPLSRKCL
jgi:hypothetical protein